MNNFVTVTWVPFYLTGFFVWFVIAIVAVVGAVVILRALFREVSYWSWSAYEDLKAKRAVASGQAEEEA